VPHLAKSENSMTNGRPLNQQYYRNHDTYKLLSKMVFNNGQLIARTPINNDNTFFELFAIEMAGPDEHLPFVVANMNRNGTANYFEEISDRRLAEFEWVYF